MTALPGDRETDACTNCGAPYFRAEVHACPKGRRLPLTDAYVKRQLRHLQAEFERPSGRHARPESGGTR